MRVMGVKRGKEGEQGVKGGKKEEKRGQLITLVSKTELEQI